MKIGFITGIYRFQGLFSPHIHQSSQVLTQRHVAVDRKGHPVPLHLTPGQVADCTQAKTLLTGMSEGVVVIADKAYNNNDLLAQVEDVKGVAVIPSKSNRKVQ